jgi:hypothetical protein
MKQDEPALKRLMIQTRVLRRRCIEAHNRIQNDSGHSVLIEVFRSLPAGMNFSGPNVEHRFLSNYAFWGRDEIGGDRSEFHDRLERSAPVPIQLLHRRMCGAVFGAWECCGEPGDPPDVVQWRSLGLEGVGLQKVALVTNVDGERAYPVAGEVRVGWMLEEGEHPALLFSISLAYEAAVRLRETVADKSWHEPNSGDFHRVEYERDLLTQATRPDFEECGLDRYYFLPLNQRRSFPSRFLHSLVDHIVGGGHKNSPRWHAAIAKATSEASLEELRATFVAARQRAGRSVGRFRGDGVDPVHFPRIAPDAQIFALFGVGPDGEIDLSDFLPIRMHLLEYLDLDESWFEGAGLSPKTPIHQARAHFDEASPKQTRQNKNLRATLNEAIERHTIRLRWVALVRAAVSDEVPEGVDLELARAARGLEPDYDELYKAADEIFGATIFNRRLDEVLAGETRIGSRMESALVESGAGERPLVVSDLPATEHDLWRVEGVGPKSVVALKRCLREAMLSWPDGFARPGGESSQEAAKGFESGLDELDELFG